MACMACTNLFKAEELAGKVVGLVVEALVEKQVPLGLGKAVG